VVLRQVVDTFFSIIGSLPLPCRLMDGKIVAVLHFICRLCWLCPGKGGFEYFIEAVSLEYL